MTRFPRQVRNGNRRLLGLCSPRHGGSGLTRRQALIGSAASLAVASSGELFSPVDLGGKGRHPAPGNGGSTMSNAWQELAWSPPVSSIVPIVQFGEWIWKDPPEDETGYVDPRDYEVSIGIQLTGTGRATEVQASTAAPLQLPEQRVDEFDLEKSDGCQAAVRPLSAEAAQLELSAPWIERGQILAAVAQYRLTLYRVCPGYSADQFPAQQSVPREYQQPYLTSSPGIETEIRAVRDQVRQLVHGCKHPWEQANVFHAWVWENIRGRIGDYTSVPAALRDRVGDCEERATVFIAFCRAAGIPARQVWIPNHAWAEFCLFDEGGQPHWIPSHTAAYPWFGWTGAHELVLQKGDKIRLPQTGKTERLVKDWMRWRGARPRVEFRARVQPVAAEGVDPGPGGREKGADGRWKLIGDHPENKYMRD